jgi:hypothetical protein
VLVPFVVTDRLGKTVEGLKGQNFTVLDDQVPQRIVSFSARILLVPSRWSWISVEVCGRRWARPKTSSTVSSKWLIDDEYSLLAVSTQPHAILGFNGGAEVLERSIEFGWPKGLTALIDTVYLGLSRMREAKRPR